MEKDNKKCRSIFTDDFMKSLKKTDASTAKLIMTEIDKLMEYENNPALVPKGPKGEDKIPHLMGGKMLTSQNSTIYSLEPRLKIRGLAHVTQREGVKVYVWLWGGPHEAYNDLISTAKLDNQEKKSNKEHGEEINKQIKEMSNLSKDKVSANIQSLRENHYSKGNKNNDKFRKS